MKLDSRSVPYRIFDNSVEIAGILVLSVLFGSGGEGEFDPITMVTFLLFGIALVGAWEFAYVQRYQYQVARDTFNIQSGVFSRREREIPYDRIQNVDIAQNVIQRLIGIAEVRLETAGGGTSEARLRYVSRPEAARLQEIISERKRGGSPERDPGDGEHDLLFELDKRELTVLGVTSANFRLLGIIMIFLFFAGTQASPEMASPRVRLLLIFGPLFAILGLVLIWVISGIQAVLRYYGFRLTRHDEELRYERGLLQRYNGTIPLSKIQTLMVRENFIARTAGYANLVIETAGYAPGQGSDSVESAVPIAKRDRVLSLATTIEGVGDIEFESAPKRARRRYMGRYSIIVGILTGVAGAYHYLTANLPDWYLMLVLLVLVPPAAHLKWKNIGYYYDDKHVVTRFGFWTRKTTIVPYYRVQTVTDTQNIFQARHGLGTVIVDTASSGGLWGGDAIALDIDIEEARKLREIAHDRFQESIQRRKALQEEPPSFQETTQQDPWGSDGFEEPSGSD